MGQAPLRDDRRDLAKPVHEVGQRHRSVEAQCRGRKPFIRRRGDRSQFVRRTFQAAFLLLNLWIGVQFYLFVRHYETAGATRGGAPAAGRRGLAARSPA